MPREPWRAERSWGKMGLGEFLSQGPAHTDLVRGYMILSLKKLRHN